MTLHPSIPAALFVATVSACWAAQTSPVSATASETEPLVSHLSIAKVKEIATARVQDTGFAVKATDPWQVALQIQPKGNVWVAMLILPDGRPSPFHLYIDDTTGNVEYLAPIVRGEQRFADEADWLFKVSSVLGRVKYPIELETLMRAAYFTGAEFSMGGSTPEGRAFLDYTLRSEKEGPARFDVRCYITEPEGGTGPKMVTSAEIAYVDAKLYRYRLVRDEN